MRLGARCAPILGLRVSIVYCEATISRFRRGLEMVGYVVIVVVGVAVLILPTAVAEAVYCVRRRRAARSAAESESAAVRKTVVLSQTPQRARSIELTSAYFARHGGVGKLFVRGGRK